LRLTLENWREKPFSGGVSLLPIQSKAFTQQEGVCATGLRLQAVHITPCTFTTSSVSKCWSHAAAENATHTKQQHISPTRPQTTRHSSRAVVTVSTGCIHWRLPGVQVPGVDVKMPFESYSNTSAPATKSCTHSQQQQSMPHAAAGLRNTDRRAASQHASKLAPNQSSSIRRLSRVEQPASH
jgi:hypothetical protein